MAIQKCPIWNVDSDVTNPYDTPDIYLVKGSYRAGGSYEITANAIGEIDDKSFGDAEKARVTSILVEQWIRGVAVPRLTADDVRRAKDSKPLPVYERAERLLRFLARSSSGEIGQSLHIGESSPHLFQPALAWSESTKNQELHFLSDYLEDQGLIANRRLSGYMFDARVEVPGYRRIEELETNPDSSQCFVAMWFNPSMDKVYENGIKPAIEDAGYSPLRIDREDFVGKVDDKIIAEIKRSRFIVADFTHKKADIREGKCFESEEGHRALGARGGVYYEAGYAEGLGLTVIPTCRRDMIAEVHFDTRQLNHIVWDNPEDLREQLENRIRRVISNENNSTS